MSAPAIPSDVARSSVTAKGAEADNPALEIASGVMHFLGSLKLTVVLFVLGIIVVFVGTVAQTEADIWQVVRDYFHAWIMWVDVNLLFPKSFFPSMPHIPLPKLPFPGGMTVGVLMAINLIAAHTWRFKIQSSGPRLLAGLAVIGVGLLVTAVIVAAGHNDSGFQGKPPFTWGQFWVACLALAVFTWGGACIGLVYWSLQMFAKSGRQSGIQSVIQAVLGILLVGGFALVVWGFTSKVRPPDEALRIVWQLAQGGLAGLIVLAGCILAFRKRAGIVVLHAGVGLLMVNELLVARQAVEWQIFLQEGQTTNYARDIRTTELAIIDPSAKETDDHTVIPRPLLERSATENARLTKTGKPTASIADPKKLLPFDVAVVSYFRNADVRDLKSGEKPVATAGRGLREMLVELPAATGTDMNAGVDFAAAYVKLTDKGGTDLGTYLVSQLASEQKNPERFAEKVTVGGKEYQLFLRFKRDYKPYAITLTDVRKDDYVASDTPRNYSSDIRLVDVSAAVDQPVHIKMNDPLRYRAETFYQSGYNRTPDGEATTLAIVRNRIWMIPYVACSIVAIGMCAHFLITVNRFISRREAEEQAGGAATAEVVESGPVEPAKGKKGSQQRQVKQDIIAAFWWFFNLYAGLVLCSIVTGIFLLCVYFASSQRQAKPEEFDFARFGRLPVAHLGRVKPFDSLARNSLQAISNRDYVKTADGKKLTAVQWLLEVATASDASFQYRVIRIDNPEVLKVFELEQRPGSFRYSVAELQPHIERFERQVVAAHKLPTEQVSQDQKKLLELDERLKTYLTLVRSFSPPSLPDLPTEQQFNQNPAEAQRMIDEFRLAVFRNAEEIKQMKAPRALPMEMPAGTPAEDHWHAYPSAFTMAFMKRNILGEEPDAITVSFNTMLDAYRKGNVANFNKEVLRYESLLRKASPPLWDDAKVKFEAFFNYFAPFRLGVGFYFGAFVLAIFGWLFRYQPLNWTAFVLLLLTFALHFIALKWRIDISGRPPVTNLYSSALFIGSACVLAGIIVEAIFRSGLGNIVAGVSGVATLIIAGLLASNGDDTVGVMQAVLDTQFWLATHVVCITLGYAATYVAGLFGACYVVFGLCTPLLNERSRKELGRMIYGSVCFAILFSFVGTVLGGLWADDSWGRFWGWDPKENGALIIVLWNALVLHARWDKMVADRGLALLAIGGNIVTSWSWFGVNQLGIGLHSYGFTNGVVQALVTFALFMLFYVAFGLVPLRLWWSQWSMTTKSASATPAATLTSPVGLALAAAFLAVNLAFIGTLFYFGYAAMI